jgi:menaquinone-dependent protoporphyrinogen oxidase
MKKILVAYATMAGSTVEVAQAIAQEIASSDVQVDVLPLSQVQQLNAYDGVVVGAPMIMGWHRAALRFLRDNRRSFQRIPLAVFVMCMRLTQTGEMGVPGQAVYVDEQLPTPSTTAGRLRFKERYARLTNYIRPILLASRPAMPASIGVFGGRLDYGRLPWWAVFFAMVVIQAPAGDRRNWMAIRSWAAGLPAALQIETSLADMLAEDQAIPASDRLIA